MNDSIALDRLHHHFARQLGCRPEDLAQGNQQLVTCETREAGNPGHPPTPLWALRRENGWVVSVAPEAFSPTNNVIQNLSGNQDPLSEPVRQQLRETVKKIAPISFYYYGLQLYADPHSFRPYRSHPVRRLTPEDLPALRASQHRLAHEEKQIEAGDAFAILDGGQVLSYSLILRLSADVWEITVATDAPYRGRGYAKAVVSAATEATLNVGRIPVYSCDEHNIASRRVAEALGYRKYAEDFVCLGKSGR